MEFSTGIAILFTAMTDHSKLKACLLLLVYAYCAYSAFRKFYGTNSSTPTSRKQGQIRYDICNKFVDKGKGSNADMIHCKQAVDAANLEASSKCSQYFQQFTTCTSRTHLPCQTQKVNFENCVNTILEQHMNEGRTKSNG